MKRRTFGLISILVLILCGMFIFAGCGSSNDTATTDTTDKVETAANSFKDDIEMDIDDMTDELDRIKTDAEEATGADAAALKARADELSKRIDDEEASIDKMVNDGVLTDEDKTDLKEKFDSLKSDVEDTAKDLETKAGDAVASAEDTAEGDAKSLKDESSVTEYLDRIEERVSTTVKNFDADVVKDSEGARDYLKQKVDEYEKKLDDLGKRIDTLVSDNVITEDVKEGYDKTIDSIKTDLDTLKMDVDKDA